jgi:uncharacterized integral membrane protein (TIGR00698 family)
MVAGEVEVSYAIATIFLFNIAAVVVFPPIGHALALSPHAFGLWAGTAINDTSSVVAASFSYGVAAGNEAVIVKLTRTVLIVPIVLVLAAVAVREKRRGLPIAWRSILPLFLVLFVVAACLNTAGLIPAPAHAWIATLALGLIVVALTGVGLSTSITEMRAAGGRPILLGGLLWIIVALSSLIVQRATGQL